MGDSWTAEQIPGQAGRLAVVTGGNGGLGLVAARELARHGARVVLACRNAQKAEAAAAEIRAAAPGADVAVAALDLGDLASVRAFATRFREQHGELGLLLNNAGVMAPPRRTTADGFELQLGTNHLGHFALTGLLLELLEATPGARVVTVSSGAHRIGSIDFDDLQRERRYSRWRAYGQSKLANLLFALELDRRLRAAGSQTLSLAAHPGYAATNLQSAAAPAADRWIMKATNALLAQSAEMGALPLLYAAAAPAARGGDFIGPDGIAEQRGHPRVVRPSAAAADTAAAARLWDASTRLTGVEYPLPAAAAAA